MTLYEKRGRRYVPVQDRDEYRRMPNGVWLVVIERGRTAMRMKLDDQYPLDELTAAEFALEDAILEGLAEHARMSDPRTGNNRERPLTLKERKAIKAYRDVMGEDATLIWTRPALADIAERAAKSVLERARKRREER